MSCAWFNLEYSIFDNEFIFLKFEGSYIWKAFSTSDFLSQTS